MELGKLEQFAVDARRELMRSVSDKIDYAMQEGNGLARLYPQAVKELKDAVDKSSKDAVVEKTAYMWFNRFCALRFMDVNGYTDSGVVTPPFGGTIPGILAEARDGNFDEGLFGSNVKERVRNILSGAAREDDPNAAAYRVLFIATCNVWNARIGITVHVHEPQGAETVEPGIGGFLDNGILALLLHGFKQSRHGLRIQTCERIAFLHRVVNFLRDAPHQFLTRLDGETLQF